MSEKVLSEFDTCLNGDEDVLVEVVGNGERPPVAHVTLAWLGEDEPWVLSLKNAKKVRDLFDRIVTELSATPPTSTGGGEEARRLRAYRQERSINPEALAAAVREWEVGEAADLEAAMRDCLLAAKPFLSDTTKEPDTPPTNLQRMEAATQPPGMENEPEPKTWEEIALAEVREGDTIRMDLFVNNDDGYEWCRAEVLEVGESTVKVRFSDGEISTRRKAATTTTQRLIPVGSDPTASPQPNQGPEDQPERERDA